MANIHRTLDQWLQIFEQHASSGLQIAAYCKQQKLNPSSFYVLRKCLTKNSVCPSVADKSRAIESNQPDWVNIIPETITPSLYWDTELALPNGAVLRMMNC